MYLKFNLKIKWREVTLYFKIKILCLYKDIFLTLLDNAFHGKQSSGLKIKNSTLNMVVLIYSQLKLKCFQSAT